MKDLLFLILGIEECFQVKAERKKQEQRNKCQEELQVYLYKVHAYRSRWILST